ncbi:MAG: hypothetical protein H7836_16300 [Magnetococcus sp. YQC-3]
MTPFQLPLPREAELQNWHVVDKYNNVPISFKIVKSKNLLTFKAEVNRFWRMWRHGEEKGRFPGRRTRKPANPTTKPPVLTFGKIGVFSHKKAAFAGGVFVKNDFQNLNGGGNRTGVELSLFSWGQNVEFSGVFFGYQDGVDVSILLMSLSI